MVVDFFTKQLSVQLEHIYRIAIEDISQRELTDYEMSLEVEKYKIDPAEVPSFDDSDIQVFHNNTFNAEALNSQMSFDISFSGDEKWFEFSIDPSKATIPNASAENQILVISEVPSHAYGVLNAIKKEVGSIKLSIYNFNKSILERIKQDL